MKRFFKYGWILIIVCLVGIASVAFAEATVTVPNGQTHKGNRFQYVQVFRNDGQIKGDLMMAAQTLSQLGEVKGDVIVVAQTLNQSGKVDGDVIGAGQDLTIDGSVLGDVRVLASEVILGGEIVKNVNVICGEVNQKQESVIGGNFHACAGEVSTYGKVKGVTHLIADHITLGGEYFGDVNINTEITCEEKTKDEKSQLTILPGTVIHGILRYRGSLVDLQKGAKIGKFEWIKPTVNPKEKVKRQINEAVWGFIRLILTTMVYFLLGLLFFKAFPKASESMREYVRHKPFNALGIGMVVIVSTVTAILCAALLLALSHFITPAFGLIFSILMLGFYSAIFFVAAIPVAEGLGEKLFGQRMERKVRFGLGLAIINSVTFVFSLLSQLTSSESFFGFMVFTVQLSILCIGSGTIIRYLLDRLRKGKAGENVPANL